MTHPAYWFLVTGLCFFFAAGVARRSGFYRTRLELEAGGRYGTIDGLRGYLALAVFGTHAVNMYTLHAIGQWHPEGTTFYSRAAEAGVSLFFMITAFLFWQRVLRAGVSFDIRGFLAGRVRRLVPMYLFSVVLVLMVVLALSGPTLAGGPMQFLKELRPWLSFGFMQTGDLNGVPNAHAINAVYWTLAFEWMFYLALPLLALFVGGWRVVALAAVVLFFGKHIPIALNFLFGALAAEAVHRKLLTGRLASPWLGPVALGLLAAVVGSPFESVYALLPEALLFAFFLFAVDGNSLFGLLRAPASRLLGMASYSLYLLHCIALFVLVHAAHSFVPTGSLDAAQYWLLAALAAVATVAASLVTYRYVELPFLRPGPVRERKGPAPGLGGEASPPAVTG